MLGMKVNYEGVGDWGEGLMGKNRARLALVKQRRYNAFLPFVDVVELKKVA